MPNQKEITDADVLAFLRAKRAELGATDITLHAYVSPGSTDGNFLISSSLVGGGGSGNSSSLVEAMAQFKASIKTPEQRAAKLRQDAAKLLAEADTINHAAADGKEAA
jgi:hypothetical protein